MFRRDRQKARDAEEWDSEDWDSEDRDDDEDDDEVVWVDHEVTRPSEPAWHPSTEPWQPGDGINLMHPRPGTPLELLDEIFDYKPTLLERFRRWRSRRRGEL